MTTSSRSAIVHVCAERGARSTMEDRHVVEQQFINDASVLAQLFAVFDGHAGSHVAAHLEENFANTLKRFLLPWTGLGNVEAALRSTFSECNNQIRTMLEDQSCFRSGGGSTAVVALLIDQRWLFVANCGDAEAVLWKNDTSLTKDKKAEENEEKKTVGQGKLICLTVSHKPETERQRIEDAGGFVMYGRVSGMLAVSRSFGDFEFCNSESGQQFVIADPHISRNEIDADGVLIVACDGLWDVFSHADAVSMALVGAEQKNDFDVARLLVDTAIRMRRSQDNVTAIVVVLKENKALKGTCSEEATTQSGAEAVAAPKSGNGERTCSACRTSFVKSDFSITQWKRGAGRSKCIACAAAAAATTSNTL